MELNPFESSFATKDLLPGRVAAESATSEASGIDNSIKSSSRQSSSSSTNLTKTPASTSESSDAKANLPEMKAPAEGFENLSSNKHNLRILNFATLNNDRLPGLTPPLFTPDGRRLPPIHLLPGIAMDSPGTPGTSMWSSLLSATNGGTAGAVAPDGQYSQSNFAQFANLMKKSGLTPNGSNLRSGFTPGVMNQHFNFNVATPGGMSNGQMTPGLQSLLGLATSGTSAPDSAGGEPQAFAMPPPPQQEPRTRVQVKEEVAAKDSSLDMPDANPVPHTKEENTDEANEEEDKQNGKRARAGSRAKTSKKKDEVKRAKIVTEEERRKQFLERNRVAASKCRQRKKQLVNKMEGELAYYSNGFRELSVQVTQLRDQLMAMRAILMNHKDCPALINSVGGVPQLQNILGQSEFVALIASNAQPNFTSIPSTIPTTLHAAPKPQIPADHGINPASRPMPPLPPQNGQVYSEEMINNTLPRNQSLVELAQGDMVKGNALRPVSSTSNLQEQKMTADYRLRPVSSMAQLPHQDVHKQFEV